MYVAVYLCIYILTYLRICLRTYLSICLSVYVSEVSDTLDHAAHYHILLRDNYLTAQ
jgi:hypothetical protein